MDIAFLFEVLKEPLVTACRIIVRKVMQNPRVELCGFAASASEGHDCQVPTRCYPELFFHSVCGDDTARGILLIA